MGAMDDRAFDIWEPLFKIASEAQGNWPRWVTEAAQTLSGQRDEKASLGVQLLSDIQGYINRLSQDGRTMIPTKDLLAYLNNLDTSPWGELRGKSLTGASMSRLLKPYRIAPGVHREAGQSATNRGYLISDFDDAFNRYLSAGVTGETSVAIDRD